jgi:hypothetical protein
MILRIALGLSGAAIGSVFGPAGTVAGWKLGGMAATGNPLHLLPGGSLLADGADAFASAADLVDIGPGDLLNGGNERPRL